MTAAEYYIQQGEARGEARGAIDKATKIAINALKKDFDVELVVDLTGLDMKVVEQLKDELENDAED